MVGLPAESRQQWWGWVQANVASPFRKRAFDAAVKSLAAGGSSEQAIAAAKQAAANRANYMATSALVLGAISAAVAFFVGGISLLTMLFAFASAVQGRHSSDRAWQAWTGVGLAILGVVIFAVLLAIH